jgi:hypothetical protein
MNAKKKSAVSPATDPLDMTGPMCMDQLTELYADGAFDVPTAECSVESFGRVLGSNVP